MTTTGRVGPREEERRQTDLEGWGQGWGDERAKGIHQAGNPNGQKDASTPVIIKEMRAVTRKHSFSQIRSAGTCKSHSALLFSRGLTS